MCFGTRTKRTCCVLKMKPKRNGHTECFGWDKHMVSNHKRCSIYQNGRGHGGNFWRAFVACLGLVYFVIPTRPRTRRVAHWIDESGLRMEAQLEIFHSLGNHQGKPLD